MMNYEDLVKKIVGGFEDEFRGLLDLGITEVRNTNKYSLTTGNVYIDDGVMSITVYSGNLKLKIDNTHKCISVVNSTSKEENNIFDVILVLKAFAVIMTTLRLKGFHVYRGGYSSVANVRIPKEIDDSLSILFNAMLKEAELDEDTTK